MKTIRQLLHLQIPRGNFIDKEFPIQIARWENGSFILRIMSFSGEENINEQRTNQGSNTG